MRARIAVLAALAAASATQAVDLQPPVLPFEDAATATRMYDHMYADLEVTLKEAQGHGRVDHNVWFDRDGIQHQSYRAIVSVRIPSDVPGFETLKAALEADVRIQLAAEEPVDLPTVAPSPTAYIPYAECTLAVQPITSRTFVYYELLIEDHGNGVRVAKGVCDIDIATPDIQVGIPQMGYLDLITSFVEHQAHPNMTFMEGYCY